MEKEPKTTADQSFQTNEYNANGTSLFSEEDINTKRSVY